MGNHMENGIALSILDQLPFMRTYTQMLLCFPIPQNADYSKIVGALQDAAAALIETIPILGGQVVNQKDEHLDVPSTGTYRVAPYHHPSGSLVRVRTLDDFPSYDQVCKAKAPASMLDATTTAPMKGFPDHYGDSDVTPVLTIQANFIPGGLLLCFAGMHNCMDGTGLGQVIRMFATLCRGEQLSHQDLEAANMDRARLPVLLKSGQNPIPHPEMVPKPDAEQKPDASNPPPSGWSYFSIPDSKLKELKVEGSKEATSGWITTNDVVSAVLWRAVTKARQSHIDVNEETTLLRAVSGRRVLDPPIPQSYIGNNVMCATNKVRAADLMKQSLSKSTLEVRKGTNAIDDRYVRSLAALIRAQPDRNKIVFRIDAPDRDFLVSSWASLPVYEDFGEQLGKPDYVRRPTSPPWTGVCYIMPKRPDGSLDLLVCLPDDDMLRLRDDEHFTAVAEYIG